jgi:hypothetical protein
MDEPVKAPRSSSNGTSPDEIEADIERGRAELAATVMQLRARLDAKAGARRRAAGLRDRATTESGRPRPEVLGAAVAAVAVLGVLVWRRTR